jgi:alpha-galactosidase
MRNMVTQLKIARPYYYGDYYPLLPCSQNSDCGSDPRKENSAGFEWAAWQFNRPEQGDGLVQAFRREENEQATQTLRLRGLDPAGTYEISNFDAKSTKSISGKELMQEGLHVDISAKRGAAVIIYKKVR